MHFRLSLLFFSAITEKHFTGYFFLGQTVEKAYRVLEGHRSIVNHARYSPINRLLFSSGVEKIIKVIFNFSL